MPALSVNWTASGDPGLLRLPDGPGLAARPTATQRGDEHACRCGRHRPVGVLLGFRSGARPRLEGHWFCRKRCLREALEERARRDFPESGVAASRVRHRVPLGLILQARGVVTAEQLQEALRLQAATGHRLGDVLQTRFGVPEDGITGAVAAQWGLPVLHLPSPSAMPPQSFAPARLFQAAGSFPVERSASGLLLACAEGPDPALALALERMYPLRVEFGVVSSSALEQWRATHADSAVPVQRVRCGDRQTLAAEAAELLYRLQPVDSRIVRVNGLWWLRMWLEEAARQQDGAETPVDTMDVLYSLSAENASTRRTDA